MKNTRRFRKALSFILAAAGLILASQGCGDKNKQEYDSEQAERQRAEVGAVIGDYQGMLYSKVNHEQIGWMKVSLKDYGQVVPSTDSSKSGERPILAGEVTLTGERPGALTFGDSYYDPTSHVFTTIITLPNSSTGVSAAASASMGSSGNVGSSTPGSSASTIQMPQISLGGRIDHGVFQGEIEAVPYGNRGGTFTLARDASIPASLISSINSRSTAIAEEQVVLEAYSGTTTFVKENETHPVNLIVLTPNNTSEQSFYNILSPVKLVEVTLNYGEDLQIDCQNATLDERTGTITAQSSLPNNDGKTETLSLKCDETSDASSSLICDHVTNATAKVATSVLHSAGVEVQNPPISPDDTQSYIESYLGDVKFQSGEIREALLNILHPRLSRQDELLDLFFPYSRDSVQVSLNFGDNTEQAIQQAQRDMNAGTLTGTYTVQHDSQPAAVTLDCRRGAPSSGNPGWDCLFFNSERGEAASASFGPTKNPPAVLNQNLGTLNSVVMPAMKGTTNLPNPTVEGAYQSATLTVTYPGRTRQQDLSDLFFPPEQRTVQASISLYDAGQSGPWTTLVFPAAVWDVASNRLDGNTAISEGSTTYGLTLTCENFAFLATTGMVNCAYNNLNYAKTFKMKFSPPAKPKAKPKPQPKAGPARKGATKR